MMNGRSRRQAVRCWAALAVAVSAAGRLSSALGAPPDAQAADVDAGGTPAPTDGSIVLVTGSLPWGVDADTLRARLSKELHAEVLEGEEPGRPSRGTLFVDTDGDKVTARFQDAGGHVTQRTLSLPGESARAADTIVLLAGNVARDEAAELRAQLDRRRAKKRARRASAGEPPAPSAKGENGAAEAEDPESAAPAPPAKRPAARTSQAGAPPGAGSAPPPPNTLCTSSAEVPTVWGGADFVPMLGSSLVQRGAVLNASLNVIGGLAGGVRGFQLGSVFNIVTGGVCGVQIGGVVNVAREGVRGLQIGGAVNVDGPLRGVQIGGALNVAQEAKGAQIGAVNVSAGGVTGAQIGAVAVGRGLHGLQVGAVNVSAGDVTGAQIGAVAVGRHVSGLQIGAVNVSAGDVTGAQVGAVAVGRHVSGLQMGAIEVASSVRGLQLGAVNVAGKVRGAQIGVLNVAEESDFSLGLVSVVRKGRLHMDVWGAETGLMMAALKHGGRYFHNVYGVGIRPLDGEMRVAFTLGLGGHVPLSSRFFLDFDALVYSIHRTDDFLASTTFMAQTRSMVGFRLTDGLALVAGPTYSASVASRVEDAALSALGTTSLHEEPGLSVHGWPGASVGVQAF